MWVTGPGGGTCSSDGSSIRSPANENKSTVNELSSAGSALPAKLSTACCKRDVSPSP